jgi:hypothetical protein
MQIYNTIANDKIIAQLSDQRGLTLFNLFQNTCNIEQALACSSLFWPEVIEVEGYYFIREFSQGLDIDKLKKRFKNDKREIERRVNVWSVSDLFLMSWTDSIQNDEIFDEFCKVLKFFWELRFKNLFPDKLFTVELGYHLYGENGMAITVYQGE